MNELQLLKGHLITAVSKHGSGQHKHGLYHYKSYEPEKYIEWCRQAGIRCLWAMVNVLKVIKLINQELNIFRMRFGSEEYVEEY